MIATNFRKHVKVRNVLSDISLLPNRRINQYKESPFENSQLFCIPAHQYSIELLPILRDLIPIHSQEIHTYDEYWTLKLYNLSLSDRRLFLVVLPSKIRLFLKQEESPDDFDFQTHKHRGTVIFSHNRFSHHNAQWCKDIIRKRDSFCL